MPKRDLNFYSELVVVTVLSLSAAYLWDKWIGKLLEKKFPNNLNVYFIVALVFTALAILILHFIFSDGKKSPYDEKKEKKDGTVKPNVYPGT